MILIFVLFYLFLFFFPEKIVCKIMKRAIISVFPAMPFQHHRNPFLLYILIDACPLNVVMIVGEG